MCNLIIGFLAINEAYCVNKIYNSSLHASYQHRSYPSLFQIVPSPIPALYSLKTKKNQANYQCKLSLLVS